MTKLKNYNSFEGKVLKEIFQDSQIDANIALIVESYIYEEVIEYRDDDYTDKIKQKYMTKYGEKEGIYQLLYKNGQKMFETNYKKGKEEGLYQYWFLYSEQKQEESYYKEDKRDGICKKWYDNGEIHIIINYKEGKEEGLYQWWYDDGKIHIINNFKDGKRNGEIKQWNERGELICHEIYHEDELIEKIL